MLSANRVKRETSRNLHSGRPLIGLLFHTDGARFIPGHTSKKGRRYAYYTATAISGPGSRKPCRLPAGETERVVAATIRSLLTKPLSLREHYSGLPVRKMRLLISSAQHRAEQLANISSTEAQSFLRAVVSRAVVGESDFAIELDREKLRHNLHGWRKRTRARHRG
jgi:site-specific DNA recombinase